MKLLFKQRIFSWFDSYDIYNETGGKEYTVKGQLSWGHLLKIYDASGCEVGVVRERILTWLPCFEILQGGKKLGSIRKELTLFRPKFHIDYNNWQVEGNWFEWDYTIRNGLGLCVATVTKELWNWSDTYTIDVLDPKDALNALMLVLAIDAEKCSRND